MALSIRNPKAEKLARKLATESRETITQAITHALEERLERLRGSSATPDLVEKILKISKRCSAIHDQDQRTADEILGYDSVGSQSNGCRHICFSFKGEDSSPVP